MNKSSESNDKGYSNLLEETPEESLVTVDKYAKMSELTSEQLQKFKEFREILLTSSKKKLLSIVYRGENKQNLEEKLFHPPSEHTDGDLFGKLFYFGEKAKLYFSSKAAELENREYLRHIDESSDETFRFIFEQISLVFNSAQYERQKGKIEPFKQNNKEFIDFFEDKVNLTSFLELARQVNQSPKREEIRDYYLLLLHNLGRGIFPNLSFFVSVSDSIEKAEWFARNEEYCTEPKPIVFVYLLPKVKKNYGVNKDSAGNLSKLVSKRNLPVYKKVVYSSDSEILIRGALFPHFIVGCKDIEKGNFVINPNVFEQTSASLNKVASNGLEIDQTEFRERIKDTGFRGYVALAKDLFSDQWLD